MQGAGTSAHVVLELFGGEGTTPSHSSGVHCLEQGPYQPIPFGPGQTDAFEVRLLPFLEVILERAWFGVFHCHFHSPHSHSLRPGSSD